MKCLNAVLVTVACALCVAGTTRAEPPAAAPELPDSFTYAGLVVNVSGEPVDGAMVEVTHRATDGYGYIAQETTDAQGRFAIDQERALSGATRKQLGGDWIRIAVRHQDYLYGRLEDAQAYTLKQCTNLSIKI